MDICFGIIFFIMGYHGIYIYMYIYIYRWKTHGKYGCTLVIKHGQLGNCPKNMAFSLGKSSNEMVDVPLPWSSLPKGNGYILSPNKRSNNYISLS